MEENKTKAKIIAVAGKGGVGKTSLCSAIVRELVEAFPGKRILAIDADPAVGLSTALGVHVEHTIDDIRNEVIETSERGEYRQAIEVLNEARFRIFDTMVECDGFAFLAIGRPEAAGCYCSVNSPTTLTMWSSTVRPVSSRSAAALWSRSRTSSSSRTRAPRA